MPDDYIKDTFQLKYYNAVTEKSVSWLWYPYIPFGKITVVQGDPGEGKTTLMLKVAAMMSAGLSIPEGEETGSPMNVIYQGAEDGNSDTIKPRLIKSGADCSRIAFIDTENCGALFFGDTRFEQAIKECNARLLIIDPLQAFYGGNPDMQKAGGLRYALSGLSKAAEESNCAVVMIGHLNKGTGSKSIYRGLGSIDVAAVARSILMVGRDKEDPATRIMVQVKSSLAPEGSAYAFSLDEMNGVQWIGPCDYSAEELLSGSGSLNRKIDQARACLELLLTVDDMKSNEVYERMQTIGIGRRTVESAKKDLGIESYKQGNEWYWHLP